MSQVESWASFYQEASATRNKKYEKVTSVKADFICPDVFLFCLSTVVPRLANASDGE